MVARALRASVRARSASEWSGPGAGQGRAVSSSQVQFGSRVPFYEFWTWLKHHFNCIVRVGGPDFSLFDLPDVHWHLEEHDEDDDALCVVQLFRAKVLCGEMRLPSAEVVCVQMLDEEGQMRFDCLVETEHGPQVAWHFLMAHGMEPHERGPNGRWTH